MIPVKVSSETRERYVRNIISVWRAAAPEQMQRGRMWYHAANQLASLITDGDARTGAGVIAASPRARSSEAERAS
ncbi:DUF7178 family protein [Streptomyces malaysiensis]|uniref:DUF7178 family protein n=1 Tax=Streptomyces malaysiensis TaxID=92644 RepID=UPI003D9EA089